ncbi:MAG TPA: ABC transporter permease subunit [Acidimicrobiales bacterium]|nr:ABC transporter permease subunit [Acidimicrobiales bacterium]
MPRDRVVLRATAARALRSGVLWGSVFAVFIVSSAYSYATSYATVAARARFSTSLAGNAGLAALFGTARRLDTVAGFTAWRSMGFLTLVGAVWGLLLATRLTRGEEDEGRWEVLLAGPTSRGAAAAQAAAGIGAGMAVCWAMVAVATMSAGASRRIGFAAGASCFLALAVVGCAAVFAAVGFVAAQVAGSRRQANALGAAVLGVAYLLRVVADAGAGVTWVRWATPLGWAEDMRPLTGSRGAAVAPLVAAVAALTTGGVIAAARRDLGASMLRPRTAVSRTRWLSGPEGLTVRLDRSVAAAWVAGLAVLGAVLGLVAQSAASAISGSAALERALAHLGGHRGGAATYLGFAFLVVAALVAFAAAAQVAGARSEEASGRLEHLLVRPVARWRWLAGRLGAAALLVVAASLGAGVAAWAGAATQHSGVGLGSLVGAGLNVAAPAVFVIGAAAFVYGVWPRATALVGYALVVWSLLVEFVASVAPGNRALLDTSLFFHMRPAPAADPDWVSTGVFVALAVVGAAAGAVAFSRRDVVPA